MPAAQSKTELLAIHDKEYAKLLKTLEAVDDAMAQKSAIDDATSIKGVVAHRIHWMKMFLTWYEDGINGRPVHVPAKGYKWNQLKEYNARLYADGNTKPWSSLHQQFAKTAQELRSFIEKHGDEELYTLNRYSWTNNWTLGRWLEASTASHFRSANTYIRKVLRQNKLH